MRVIGLAVVLALWTLSKRMPNARAKLRVSAMLACLVLGGCSLWTPQKPTELSGITQQLLIRSLERALAQLDIEQLKSRNVAAEVFLLAGPETFVRETFVREFVVAWLRAHGIRTVADSPEIRVKAFASVFGTDTDTTLIGIPAFQAPVVNLPIPEIALFKWHKARGQAELRLYEFDGKTDLIVNAPRPGIGHAKHDKFTVLLIIGFTQSDLEERD
jgi:hypothetical protein